MRSTQRRGLCRSHIARVRQGHYRAGGVGERRGRCEGRRLCHANETGRCAAVCTRTSGRERLQHGREQVGTQQFLERPRGHLHCCLVIRLHRCGLVIRLAKLSHPSCGGTLASGKNRVGVIYTEQIVQCGTYVRDEAFSTLMFHSHTHIPIDAHASRTVLCTSRPQPTHRMECSGAVDSRRRLLARRLDLRLMPAPHARASCLRLTAAPAARLLGVLYSLSSEVQRVRLSRSSCMMSVESL